MKTLVLRLENVVSSGYFPVYVIRQDIRRVVRDIESIQLVIGRNEISVWSAGCPEGAIEGRHALFVRGFNTLNDKSFATLTLQESKLVFDAIVCPAHSILNRERMCL